MYTSEFEALILGGMEIDEIRESLNGEFLDKEYEEWCEMVEGLVKLDLDEMARYYGEE